MMRKDSMITMRNRLLVVAAVLAVVAGACSDDGGSTTGPPATTSDAERALQAPAASITVDGDPADWTGVPALDVTLEAIEGVDAASVDAAVQVAHDGDNIYVLFTVIDDYNWEEGDAHVSASPNVMWAIDSGAGPHMGAEEPDRKTSLGMVDLWHWEIECGPGTEQGGAASADSDDGNDPDCNFDDEWAADPKDREDDNAENSLLGVFTHTAQQNDAVGTYYFEMSRPLQTGDAEDAQFAVGDTALLALAYFDPDTGGGEWDEEDHVVSSYQGWIRVTLAA